MNLIMKNISNSTYGNDSISSNESPTGNVLSTTEVWFFGTWLCICTIFTILGNLLIIVRYKRDRFPHRLAIYNRAIADFCVGLLNAPISVITLSTQTWILWVINRLTTLCLVSSVHALMFSEIELMFAVIFLFVKRRDKIFMIILTWLWSIVCGGLIAFIPDFPEKQCGQKYPFFWTESLVLHLFLHISVIYLPFIIITGSYIPIIRAMKRIQSRTTNSSKINSASIFLIIRYLCFVVCWMPYAVYSNYFFFKKDRLMIPGYINALISCLVYTHSASHSFIHNIRHYYDRRRILQQIRRAFPEELPKEIQYLNIEDKNLFNDIVSSGFYYSYVGKIMVLGNEGVGKTAITANIIGRKPSSKRKPTEGIDVHTFRAAIDMEYIKLIPKELQFEDIAYRNLIMQEKYGKVMSKSAEDQDLEANHNRFNDQDCFLIKISEADVVPLNSGIFLNDAINRMNTDDNRQTGTDTQNDTTGTPNVTDNTLWAKIRRFVGVNDPQEDLITQEMIIEGLINAGKKGVHIMKEAPVIILDFAGQRVFYSTHQSFLTYRGVYVLTINGSVGLDDELPTESSIPGRHGKPTTRDLL